MPIIVCNVDMFLATQTVNHIGDGFSKTIAKVPTKALGSCIAGLCYNLETYDVKLIGQKEYLDGIIEDIHNSETVIYNNKKINIEVI